MKAKRITAALLALVLIISCAPAFAASYHSKLRILLSTGDKSSLDFTPVGDFYLLEAPELKISGDELTVSAVGSRASLTIGGKTVTSASLTLVNRDYGERSSYIRLRNSEHGTCTYLGNMTFDVKEGRIRAINTLPTEQYLYGVVPNEMSNSFPIDAQKAQAICARSYAMAKCSRYATRAYDLRDTSDDQVYCGFASKNTRAIAAVDATAGQVLTYGGDIIEAFYSSSNGGQTESTVNVWSEELPYYINADDPFDLANPSSMEYLAFIPRVYNERTIAAMDRDVYNVLLREAVKAANDSVTLISTVRVTPHTPKYPEPSRCFTLADVTLTVQKSDGSTGQLTVTLTLDSLLYGSIENTLGAFNARTYTLRLRGAEEASVVIDGESHEGFNLTMRRYGHGVGLSQRGAQQRAREGQAYSDILAFYYVGTALACMGGYESAPRLTSETYSVSESGISGVAPDTSVSDFMRKLESAGTLSLLTYKGNEKSEGVVTTGDIVRTVYDDGKCFFELPVIIYGDVNGEGGITSGDVDALAEHIMRKRSFSGAYLAAADVDRNGTVDSRDLLMLIQSLCGDCSISQKG